MRKTYTLLKNSRVLRVAIFLLISLGMAVPSIAQTRTITGTVTASDTQETLPGASVLVKGTTTGTVTDLDGRYSLPVPTGSLTLVFSFVGYETMEVAVTSQAVVDVSLNPSKVALDEVVVIGYGTVKKATCRAQWRPSNQTISPRSPR